MKGFGLTSSGDIKIEKNQIVMVENEELLRQNVQSVLGTNKGEWTLNTDEGIAFQNILGKSVNEDIVRYEILKGLTQADSSFVIDTIEAEKDTARRKLTVKFTAKNENGETVSGVKIWG